MTCKHCQKSIPLQNGIHMYEEHMERCDDFSVTRKLELEPKNRDTWYRPEKRLSQSAPFVCGGGK
ncbi:hypothetical protein LL254_00470 [Marinobacter nauticus]|uniref:hypothetical protein n=1 Tax=Marinobacter nauticus TaxID=2743 RepID=UPI001D18A394|nr:hypothetical protein [Marinobacter nauticus]MCC4269180.1 hypothetical protein [Marinobacter nauticus]